MKQLALYSTSLLALVAFSTVTVTAADGGQMDSNTYVSIEKNEGEEGEKPVNPVDPTKPVEPGGGDENPHPPSTKGPLSLNYVSNLKFGSQKASGNDAVYSVKADYVLDETNAEINVPNFVQITDNRGTNSGWTLMVKQNGAFKNGANTLAGTELVFKNPVLSSVSGKAETSPTANGTFTLTAAGQSALVMSAKEDQGMGTWLDRFGDSNEQATSSIQLKIPGDSKKVVGLYQTSLTWTLSDVPGK